MGARIRKPRRWTRALPMSGFLVVLILPLAGCETLSDKSIFTMMRSLDPANLFGGGPANISDAMGIFTGVRPDPEGLWPDTADTYLMLPPVVDVVPPPIPFDYDEH
jgi:hypothetical protein